MQTRQFLLLIFLILEFHFFAWLFQWNFWFIFFFCIVSFTWGFLVKIVVHIFLRFLGKIVLLVLHGILISLGSYTLIWIINVPNIPTSLDFLTFYILRRNFLGNWTFFIFWFFFFFDSFWKMLILKIVN